MTIKIMGIGDAGGYFVRRLYRQQNRQTYTIITLNSTPHLSDSPHADEVYQLKDSGFGTGGNPMLGRQLAEKSKDALYDLLAGTDQLIITAGMGGGTGTGAAHVVAYVASELHIPTLAVVSTPFSFEGENRHKIATLGVKALRKFADDVSIVSGSLLETTMHNNRAPHFKNLSVPLDDYYTYLCGHVHFDILRVLNAL